jgi:glycine cleavage system aminomethyltransferase T
MSLLALEAATPGAETVLRSPIEHRLLAAGGTVEQRGAWRVAVGLDREDDFLTTVAFADASHLAKLDVRGGEAPAERPDRAVLEIAAERWIVLCPWAEREAALAELGDRRLALDLSGAWMALVLAGPDAERLLRRLGPIAAVPGSGPIAGVPGRVVRRGDRLLVLVASEFAQHVWDVCADLCLPLDGGPASLDAVVRAGDDPLLAP